MLQVCLSASDEDAAWCCRLPLHSKAFQLQQQLHLSKFATSAAATLLIAVLKAGSPTNGSASRLGQLVQQLCRGSCSSLISVK